MKCIALHHQNYQTVSSANMLQIFTEYPVLGLPALIFSFIGLYNNIHTFNFSSKGKWINEEDIKKQNNVAPVYLDLSSVFSSSAVCWTSLWARALTPSFCLLQILGFCEHIHTQSNTSHFYVIIQWSYVAVSASVLLWSLS